MKKILVVEDDDALRELYIQILTEAGLLVESASDGAAGLETIQKGGYDLILLDLVMPKMDGISVLQNLVSSPPIIPNGQIIVLSNLGKDDAIGKAIELGANGYMIKSDYTPDKIVEQVKQLLST